MIQQYGVFIFLSILAYAYYVHHTNANITAKSQQSDSKIWTYYSTLVQGKQVLASHNIYNYQDPPVSLDYVQRDRGLKSIFDKLYVLRVFEEHLIGEILILAEHFLRVHYKVLLGKYDPKLYIQTLEDCVHQIDILFGRFIYNVPNVSSLFDIPNLDTYVEKEHDACMRILHRYVQIVRNKYKLEVNVVL